jgi:hypothetical protein
MTIRRNKGARLRSFLPIIGGAGGESGQAYSSQTGHWIKRVFEDVVDVWVYTQFSNKGVITGDLMLKNLPIATANVPGFFAGVCQYSSNLAPSAATISSVMLYAGGAQTQANIMGFDPGTNPRHLVGADVNNLSQFVFHISYPIDPP